MSEAVENNIPEISDLSDDATFGKEYIAAPTGELLKMHVSDIKGFKQEKTDQQGNSYVVDSTIFYFTLDEGEGKGQVYTKWGVTPSTSENSNWFKLSKMLFKDPLKMITLKKSEIVGAPIQIGLKPGKMNPNKLGIDLDVMAPPSKDQEWVKVEAPAADPTSVPSDQELEDLFKD
jgi:hypothetical protein